MATTSTTSTTSTPCEHDSARGARTDDSPVTNAWECDDCGHLAPFTDADYAFVNARPWRPAPPADVTRLAWMLMSPEARLAVLTA